MRLANSVIDECESTNDLARRLAEEGAPHGTWVSARRQLAGRGRLGRRWESIEGNLFLSVIARPTPGSALSWIPLATAVAAAELLRELHPGLAVEIKWPNDLWLERRKVGGILCEAVGGGREPYVVIGLGVNCVRAPRELDQEAESLTEFLGARVEADEIRGALIAAILAAFEELGSHGPDPLRARYERIAAFRSGDCIEWGSGAQVSSGVIEGLGTAGELLVLPAGGGPATRLFAEDVHLRKTAD